MTLIYSSSMENMHWFMRIVTLTESQLDILFSHTSSRSQAISSGKSEIGQFMNNKWNLSTIRSEFIIFYWKQIESVEHTRRFMDIYL